MKRLVNFTLAILAVITVASCGEQTAKEETKKVDAIEVSVDSLLNDASALEGKTVRFTATVDHACMHGGKRLTVFGTEKGKTLKVDGTESSPRFASSLMGKEVEVTGTVKKVPGSVVADCEVEEGNEIPEIAYVIECIDFTEK